MLATAQSLTPVICAYLGDWDWDDCGPRSAQAKKFARPHLSGRKLGMVVGTCHLRDSGTQNGRVIVQAGLEKWETLSPK
jgi:hypothetical protein